MNPTAILLCIGVFLFFSQIILFLSCLRWLTQEKRKRVKEFAILDADRNRLIQMQNSFKNELQEAKKLSSDAVNKLRILGAETHAEWEEMTEKINHVLLEVDKGSKILMEENLSAINMAKMALEKTIKNASQIDEKIQESIKKSQKVLRLFDKTVPPDEIFKSIQADKYSEAKTLLADGMNASCVAKKIGLSMGEVIMLSSYL